MSCNICLKVNLKLSHQIEKPNAIQNLQKFGFFTKEVGCEICKYSFCSKCRSYQVQDETNLKKKLNACLKCFHQYDKKTTEKLESSLDHLLEYDQLKKYLYKILIKYFLV